MMGATLEVGTVSIAFKSVATALAVVLVTVVLTGVVEFLLDREIVPRLNLRPGAGYAIVTFTRWSMFIVGAALALAALGIDMGKITLMAGALSVGIGFGLQNVINNFVSGLILIVERPIGVGDVIEWGSKSGTIMRIGIRSSTVRTGQGAEILVPNGDLVAKEVVNWTRSDRQRRYDIDIDVALDSEPEQCDVPAGRGGRGGAGDNEDASAARRIQGYSVKPRSISPCSHGWRQWNRGFRRRMRCASQC